MEEKILTIKTFKQFHSWLKKNHNKEKYCWVCATRGKPSKTCLHYFDAVYAALCFGWIDSIFKVVNGKSCQKFSPRKSKTSWTQLNIERVKWLIKHKLMDKSGLAVCPDLNKEFVFDKDLIKELKKDKEVWKNFNSFPPLYQRIRAFNTTKYKQDKKAYKTALDNLIKNTKANKMYGQWNDNGRLN